MSIDTAYAAIRSRLEAAWPSLEPTVPLAWQNDGYQRDVGGAAFLLVRVEYSGGEPATIGAPGSNRVRRYGNIWLDAFVPVGTGNQRPLQILTRAATVFEEQDFSGIVCSAAEPGAGEAGSDDGLYFGVSNNVPFWFDEDA